MLGKMDGAKVSSSVRKSKKKQVKDEMDRIKQAEKKKRRLEKALATSAAIRSELEMKKQKKKEELQRLDEEGAATAEAVALHVLLGEDLDDSCNVILKEDEGFNQRDLDMFSGQREEAIPCDCISKYWLEGVGWVPNPHQSGCMWNGHGNTGWMISSDSVGGALYPQYLDEGCWDDAGISAGLIAAQAFSSLHIADDTEVDKYVFNHILRG